MECPFCAEDFNDAALVCKSCGRDLRLVLPVIEENRQLVRQAEALILEVNRLNAARTRRDSPLRFWLVYVGVFIVAPIAMLLAAHYACTVMFNVPLIYLRLGTLAIPLPFGLALLWVSHHGIPWAAVCGAIVGAFGVLGMLAIVGFADNIPILPENLREWREVGEFAASIMLAYVTGNVLAMLARRMLPKTLDSSNAPSPAIMRVARIVGGPVGKQALRRRAQKIADNLGTIGTAAGALGTAGASLFAGIRALLGDGS